jgi:hypothetical protein
VVIYIDSSVLLADLFAEAQAHGLLAAARALSIPLAAL